jgi:hypothetical protein
VSLAYRGHLDTRRVSHFRLLSGPSCRWPFKAYLTPRCHRGCHIAFMTQQWSEKYLRRLLRRLTVFQVVFLCWIAYVVESRHELALSQKEGCTSCCGTGSPREGRGIHWNFSLTTMMPLSEQLMFPFVPRISRRTLPTQLAKGGNCLAGSSLDAMEEHKALTDATL